MSKISIIFTKHISYFRQAIVLESRRTLKHYLQLNTCHLIQSIMKCFYAASLSLILGLVIAAPAEVVKRDPSNAPINVSRLEA